MEIGEVVREARKRQAISQRVLALRASTDQAAISRIERGEISPSIETVERLLAASGEQLSFEPLPLERDYDPLHMRATLRRSPEERLRLAMSWNRLAGRLSGEGRRARAAEHRPEPLDAQRILEELTRHEVDYVLVGGLAAQTHGNTRMTNDVDLIPAPDPRNLDRLAGALQALDARMLNPGDVNVLHDAPGAAPYPELRDRALVISLDEARIPVAGRDDLIRMKLARGRPIDRADVAALTDPGAE